MTGPRFWLACALACAALTPASAQAPTSQPPPLTIRFIWFTATPKPAVRVDPEHLPAVFSELQKGWSVPLTEDPGVFLKRLEKAAPNFTYRLRLAGTAGSITDQYYVISAGPRDDDPQRCTVQEVIRIVRRESPTTVRTRREARLLTRSANGSVEGSGWNSMGTDDGDPQVLGRTTSMGTDCQPDGTLTVYATYFVERKAPAQ
jgi:hypothetical protein